VKIVIITQDSPFYLGESIAYLLADMPSHSTIVGCVLLAASPFGKKDTGLGKIRRTYHVFGPGFFIRYASRFMLSKLMPSRNVRHILRAYGIPMIELRRSINSQSSLETIKAYHPDLLISIQANVIFKRPLIDLAPKGCLNVHTALLPKYRGLMPTFWVMKNDEKETGVSVFFIDEGIDSGPILVQKRLEIGERSLDELIKDTKRMGMDAVVEAIELIESGDYHLMENDDGEQTYYSFPTHEDVLEFKRAGKKFF
jgi:methionyl-tRNA formyltransferase